MLFRLGHRTYRSPITDHRSPITDYFGWEIAQPQSQILAELMTNYNLHPNQFNDRNVLELIKELAEFERAPELVTNTVPDILRDGFSENPAFGCLLAETGNAIAGMSLYYTRYSTWRGKLLYLEDIIVRDQFRRQGIGTLLFEETMRRCMAEGMNGMTWQVLDWNSQAIDFYKKYAAKFDPGWVNVGLTADEINGILKASID
jgi:ribosomal protein S18 acetylase RimI-like enzyme